MNGGGCNGSRHLHRHQHVGEDIAVRLGRQVLDSPKNRLPYRSDSFPDLHRDGELPIPLEQSKKRDVDELVVNQYAVEQLGKVRPDRPLTNSGVSKQEHDAGPETVSHGTILYRRRSKPVVGRLLQAPNTIASGCAMEARGWLKRVELILGSPLRQAPPTPPGVLGTFTVTTEAGTGVIADIWFRSDGVVPNSNYLGDALAPERRADGFIEVGPTLQVAGRQPSSQSATSSPPTARWPLSPGTKAQSWQTTSSPSPRDDSTSPTTNPRASPSPCP